MPIEVELKEFSSTIKRPPLSQSVKVRKKNFLRYGSVFGFLFANTDEVDLTRDDVFHYFRRSTSEGILAALAWGFQKGGLPGGVSFSPVTERLDYFGRIIDEIKSSSLNEALFNELNGVPGVKNGMTTKFLYFSNSRVQNARCMIFDSRVRLSILEKYPESFQETIKHLPSNSLYPGWIGYINYCKELQSLAKSTSIPEDLIEIFLFQAAPGKKPPTHKIA